CELRVREPGPGDGRRTLPASELRRQVDGVGDLDPDDRVAGRRGGVGEGIGVRGAGPPARQGDPGEDPGAAAPGAREGDPEEYPLVAVLLDRPNRLEVDRHDPDAAFAGALGDQLLDP